MFFSSMVQTLRLESSVTNLGLLAAQARPHENSSVKFSVKKLMPQFWVTI